MAALAVDCASESPAPGVVLCSKYRLVQELGTGGMGTVWLARNEAIGKDVAVKLLRADARSEDAAERFLREARAGASVEHPAIVRIFDYGQTETAQPFIVMERLEGESLADVIDKHHSISAIDAVRALLPVVDGLAAAHEAGIVHRDLKPENVFLAVEGGQMQPKVLDFGVAKLPMRDSDLHLTRQGAVVGSPFYMAPEQARGLDDVDHRCDIWAVCVILYEAVSGSLPFDADNYNAVLMAIIERELTPLVGIAGEDGLWDVLSIGLRKERSERYGSMRELGEALARYLARHGVVDDIRGVPLTNTWLSEDSMNRHVTLGRTLATFARVTPTPVAPSPAPRRRPIVAIAAICAAAAALLAFAHHVSSEGPAAAQTRNVAAQLPSAVPSPPLVAAPATALTETPPPAASTDPPAIAGEKPKGDPEPAGAAALDKARAPARATGKSGQRPPRAIPLDLKDPY